MAWLVFLLFIMGGIYLLIKAQRKKPKMTEVERIKEPPQSIVTGMTEEHIVRLAGMLDPAIWKNPPLTVRFALDWFRGNYRAFELEDGRAIPVPPDYRDVAKIILRSGTELTKEQKRGYGIHLNAKVSTSAIEHLTQQGLRDCVQEAQTLALAIGAIEHSLINLHDWKEWGEKKVGFSPAPDACPQCKKLKKTYAIDKTPIPVLDTHLGCRCCLVP
ncbi:MAG: hypothetical protein Q8J64_06635 [Thermodesulfovibrionales bacterium]|nr:hypothetical protein [Thermodesulfovibrionales bacterium]